MPIDSLIKDHQTFMFHGSISSKETLALVKDPKLKRIQTSSQLRRATLLRLNDELFAHRPDVALRVYGFYGEKCDLSFLDRMSNLRRFSADSLTEASGIESIAALKGLASLSLGIYSLQNFDVLSRIDANKLVSLHLGPTRSRKPSLEHVSRFKKLKSLSIEGQSNGLEAISPLHRIESLLLRSVSAKGVDFIRPLKKLRSLDLKLGGIADLSALEGMERIRYLELWMVKGLWDISVISSLRGLQYLFLESLSEVRSIPDLSNLRRLRRVHLESLKRLRDIRELERAPALEEFIHFQSTLRPEKYRALINGETLRQIHVTFGNRPDFDRLREMANKRGLQQCHQRKFKFAR